VLIFTLKGIGWVEGFPFPFLIPVLVLPLSIPVFVWCLWVWKTWIGGLGGARRELPVGAGEWFKRVVRLSGD